MQSSGWVSFDDDSGGSTSGVPTAPPVANGVAPAVSPTRWSVHFDSQRSPSLASSAHNIQQSAGIPVSPITATIAPVVKPDIMAPQPAALRDREIPTPSAAAAPLTAPPAVFPSFAALYANAPSSAKVAMPSGLTPADNAAYSSSTPLTDTTAAAAGSFIQRLPRPPTSTSRGQTGAPMTAVTNPFLFLGAPPVRPGTSGAGSNPFAASANPLGTTAASRSLDPFADLSLRPNLPRPPPMAASRGIPSPNSFSTVSLPAVGVDTPVRAAVQDAGASGGVGMLEPAQTQLNLGVSGVTGSVAVATAAVGVGTGLRRPPTARLATPSQGVPETQPVLGTVTVPVPGVSSAVEGTASSVFQTFTAVYSQQQSTASSASAAAPQRVDTVPAYTVLSGVAGGAVAPHAVAAGPTSNLLEVDISQPAAAHPGLLSGHRQGILGDVGFDALASAAKHSSPSHHARADVAVIAAAQALAPPSSSPSPYSVAVNLPDPSSSVLEESFMSSPPDLPAPPPYTVALNMPDAQPLSPPPYDEAVTFPTAEEPFLDRRELPFPRGETSNPTNIFTAFDDSAFTNRLAARSAPPAQPPRMPPYTASSSFSSQPSTAKAASAPPPDQICVEVRLPPLKPKEAAWPKRIVASMGLLFAAPGGDGVAVLQWRLFPGAEHDRPTHGPRSDKLSGPHFAMLAGRDAGLMAHRSTEDEDSAPAASILLPPPLPELQATSCMLLDDVTGSLWTGHKDGRVVRWSVEPGRVAMYEHHWRAHVRGKITSMILSPWGDLWTASSGGSIRVWQYQSGLPASRPPVKLFECRRCRLAMGQAARANAQRPHSKARLVCLGPSGRVVWSAGRTGMALWGAYDGEFLGALTPGLQQDTRLAGAVGQGICPGVAMGNMTGAYEGDTGSLYRDGGAQQQQLEINPQTGLEAAVICRHFRPRLPVDASEEGEAGDTDLDLGQQVIKGLAGAAKLAFKLGKKIRQNFAETTGVGAANEASGVSEANGSGPGSRGKVVALLPGLDEAIYVAYQRGLLEKYTEWGRLLWSRDYGRRVELYSAVLMGSLLWLGCGDGVIRTAAAATGELCHSWKAHDFPVVGLAHDFSSTGRGSALVYSMSENGSVRGWPAVRPSEAQRLAWRNGLLPSLQPHKLTILATTWNVNETRPSPQSLKKWLEPAATADIVSVSLQEVEVGTSSVAWDAAVTLLSKSMLERGNQNAQSWSTELAAALATRGGPWERVALRQMSGLVIVVFCRADLLRHVGEVATANVACGVMGVGGNKGAVAVSMSVFRRRVMFVCSHFAAHQERVDERNENYSKIVRMLHFDNTSKVAQQQLLLRQQQQQQVHQAGEAGGDGCGLESEFEGSVFPSMDAGISGPDSEDDGHGPGLSDAALLVWAGDFNYRINGLYSDVCEMSSRRMLRELFQLDQCRIEMEKGNVFRGLREPLPLGFPVFVPTYKYEKTEAHREIPPSEPGGISRLYLPFDRSEKQRVPAWTDRVLIRGSRPGSLDVAEEEVIVAIGQASDYNCILDVNDSDHKPVFALLQVQLPGYAQEEKRNHSLASALTVHKAFLSSIGTVSRGGEGHPIKISASRLELRPYCTSSLDLYNCSSAAYVVQIMAERRHDANLGVRALALLPSWLEVSPTIFSLTSKLPDNNGTEDQPQGVVRVSLRVLALDSVRPSEQLQLRFVLRPMWGCVTLSAALGPVVTVTLR